MLTKPRLCFACVVVVCTLVMPASASPPNAMLLGLFDDAVTLNPAVDSFPLLQSLHVQVVRMTLTWGGPGGVANKQPAHPADPSDPAYDWTRYDQAVERANDAGIEVLLTIVGTPAWANGGQSPRQPPTAAGSLRAFAYAAAQRYSGTFLDTSSGIVLPRVSLWLAWNEPNNPVFLQPQFTRVNGRWEMAAAAAYARICNAVYSGVHATGGPEQVACGATAPRGNNSPSTSRASISPLAFLRAAKQAGLRTFDAWADHPYYGNPSDTPTTTNLGSAIELGNIDKLVSVVTGLYGTKPIWITEYGYQTNPPDTFFGVSWAKQADYLREAYDVAKSNPRIQLFTWFLLRDSTSPNGWQSGLETAAGKKKPSFVAFADLRAQSL
jgi:Glycosyl hydrolase catalytic core